jgi:hypothetical protein
MIIFRTQICFANNKLISSIFLYLLYFGNKFYREDMSQFIPLCPILRPTFEEFKDFEQFVNRAEE